MYFKIHNFSHFSKVVWWIYRMLVNIASRVWGNTLPSGNRKHSTK